MANGITRWLLTTGMATTASDEEQRLNRFHRVCTVFVAVVFAGVVFSGVQQRAAAVLPIYFAEVIVIAASLGLSFAGRHTASKICLNYVSVYLGVFAGLVWDGSSVHFWFLATSIYAAAVYRIDETKLRWVSMVQGFVLLAVFEVFGNRLLLPWHFQLSPQVTQLTTTVSIVCCAAVCLFFAGFMALSMRRAQLLIEKEHERSERLLLNILPASIAHRLKDGDTTIAESFDSVSVLFADIVGFTELSQRVSPHDLVERLNDVFSAFDELTEKHGLEKIKTIGDAYMVSGGVPDAVGDHAKRLARLALDIQDHMAHGQDDGDNSLMVRIGMHTGPVVAGVIGVKKFVYDLWGDTVNTASRMESHGVPGRIHVSEAVRDRLHEDFQFEFRGTVDVKGKGPMQTYFLEGPSNRH